MNARRLLLPSFLILAVTVPAIAGSRVNEARILAGNGQLDQARTILEEELLKDPQDTRARIAYGTVLHGLGRHDDARRNLRQVIRASDNAEADAVVALANVESATGNLCEAERLTRGWKGRTAFDLNLLVTRLKILRTLREVQEARDVAETILAADPLNSEASAMLRHLQATGRKPEQSTSRTCRESVVRRLWTKMVCRGR